MGKNIKEQLCAVFQKTSSSLQLDKTTTSDNKALLMAYVRYLSDGQIMEELLFCKYLKTDIKRQTIYQTLIAYMQDKSVPITIS
jgi:hypothetical protein